jgi:cytochrome c1
LRALIGVAVLLLVAVAGAAFVIHNNERELARRATALTGGDPYDGKEALLRYGCGACHTIPGVQRANGLVGPPLAGIARRVYVAGVLYNTPDNLMLWIRNPPGVDPLTAMPDTGVTEGDARDIAAFLYTLR